MADRSVAIRLGVTGQAQVENSFAGIGNSGDAAAKRLTASFNKAGDDVQRAMDRQAAAAEKLMALSGVGYGAAPNSAQVAQLNDSSTGKSAQASAAIFTQAYAEMERQADALRQKIDPLYAAQRRYDDEVKNAEALLKAEAISQETYAAAISNSERALNTAKQALDGHSNGLGFNRTQFLIAEGAAHRYIDSILAGMSPMRAFMMQAGDIGNILAMDDGGMAGGLAKVRGLITPVTVGIASLTGVLLIGAAAWYSYTTAIDKLNALAIGAGARLGETGAQLEANAEAAAAAGHITVGAARDIEAGYLQVARSGDVLVGLTAITKDYAAATGQDAKGAQQELNSTFGDTIAGAQAMAEKYGAVTQAQIEHIAKLVEEGNETAAQQELLSALRGAFDGAAEHGKGLAKVWDDIKIAAAGAWEWMGKAIDRMGISGALNDQIKQLESQRDRYGQTDAQRKFLQGQIDGLRRQLAQESDRSAQSAQQRAQAVADQYTGAAVKDKFRRDKGTLAAGIAAGGTPEQIRDWTAAFQANEHALTSWIPAQEKANKLADLDAQIAAAKTPALKRQLAARREEVALYGEVVTAADAHARSIAKGDAAAAHATHSNAAHAASLARQAESMEVNTSASLDLAEAYLQSSSAAIEAEARRKALTEATRKGIDGEAQYQRQLALTIAETVKNSAASVAHLRDENSARQDVLAQVASGTLDVKDMNRALADEDALRPLLILKTLAHGRALKDLTDAIAAYRVELAKAHKLEDDEAAARAIDGAIQRSAEIRAAMGDLGADPITQARNAAIRAANRQADDLHRTGADRDAFLSPLLKAANDQADFDRARYLTETSRQMANENQMITAQISLLGATADQRARILDHLQREQAIREHFPNLDDAEVKAQLAIGDALEENRLKLEALGRSMDEVRQFGDQFVDDVLNTDNWKDWGDFGQMVLKDLEREMMKLAVINPIKNFLFGENNPTGGGFFSSLGSLFGGGKSGTVTDIKVGANAAGTDNWSGGLTWVNEHGPEMADLPNGTRIYPAAETRRMLANDNSRAVAPQYHFDLRGAVLTQDLLDQMNEIGRQSAKAGAEGGFRAMQDFNQRSFGRR